MNHRFPDWDGYNANFAYRALPHIKRFQASQVDYIIAEFKIAIWHGGRCLDLRLSESRVINGAQ